LRMIRSETGTIPDQVEDKHFGIMRRANLCPSPGTGAMLGRIRPQMALETVKIAAGQA
jgi:hypothetical protein